ncbi:MAG TPA: CoA ester lyase, partial [Methylophilaceae bacterium]|nr:CoA ester lyase [Methylophilaceae bacterium]
MNTHPSEALFSGEKLIPIIPSCEHFAGSEKLILKALQLQDSIGQIFDVTCDCEDGAAAGQEEEHAKMIVKILNSEVNKYGMAGARIHDYTHASWKKDVEILVQGLGNKLSYITIPKSTNAKQVKEMISYIQQIAQLHQIKREIP